MNPPADPSDDPQAIRAQIDETRQRMDHTIDALKNRFTGRHLIDEALGYFRTHNANGTMNKITHKISTSANTAVHSVVDSVKANPVPALLIGAGVAWFLYDRTRSSAVPTPAQPMNAEDSYEAQYDYDPRDASDLGISLGEGTEVADTPDLESESGATAGGRIQHVTEKVRERASELGQRVRQRTSELGHRSQELYRAGRQRAASTIEHHPLESGLACLAVGLIAGLAMPTPPRVRRTLAPAARQVRQRAEEVASRGRVVIRAAAQAAKTEAEKQGLTTRSASSSGSSQPGAARESTVPEGLAQSSPSTPPPS